jgi:hypothetical protein
VGPMRHAKSVGTGANCAITAVRIVHRCKTSRQEGGPEPAADSSPSEDRNDFWCL